MAGIGFELRRMIDERRGFVAKVRAYSCAALIASGPWLMTILTLTLLNVAGPYLGGDEGYSLFRALVTYAFAFSLILQGIVQMAVTRWVADALYGKRYEDVLPAFAACIAITGLLHAVIGTAFCTWAGFAPRLSLLAVTLFTIIGMTWIALIWLSLVRQYDDVLRAYVYGTLVAMMGVLLVFLSQGTEPILAAYTAGQAFTLVLLLRTILRGMDTGEKRDYRVFKSLVSFPVLAGVGFAYNAAIWVDKMIFWFADGIGPHRLVRYHPLYDTCSFLAYLTVVPALALNLVQLETAFYERYRAYYGAILAGSPLAVIERNRTRMFESLREGIVRLLRVQGAITAAVVIFAPLIVQGLELPEIAVRLFRLTCLGAGFHVLLLICILMQMYFDLRAHALATSATFLVLNGVLAWWSVNRGIETYGVGYALASFLTLLLGFVLLHRAMDRLDYHTFTSQPIGSKEERREAEKLAEAEREKEAKEAAAPAAAPAPAPVAAPAEPVPFAAGEMGTIDTEKPEETPAEVPGGGLWVAEDGATAPPDTVPAAPAPKRAAPVAAADAAGADATVPDAAPAAAGTETSPADTMPDLPSAPEPLAPPDPLSLPDAAARKPAATAPRPDLPTDATATDVFLPSRGDDEERAIEEVARHVEDLDATATDVVHAGLEEVADLAAAANAEETDTVEPRTDEVWGDRTATDVSIGTGRPARREEPPRAEEPRPAPAAPRTPAAPAAPPDTAETATEAHELPAHIGDDAGRVDDEDTDTDAETRSDDKPPPFPPAPEDETDAE
ncbi:MAG TPA: exopolysaccharide Pel transporter PelG [Planctomycetota bacterium]|nr:exopolysaccharide Pel transporter PelG [Planctomycetota bacterium]